MSDIEEEVHDGKEIEIEGTDPRDVYQRYEGTFKSLLEADDLEKKVSGGKYIHDLNYIAAGESEYSTGKKKWFNGKIKVYGEDKILKDSLEDEKPTNTAALYPWVKKGIHRRQKELAEAKEGNLESIISHTPDKTLEGLFETLFKRVPPQLSLGGEFGEIAKVHSEYKRMETLWKMYNEGIDPNDPKGKRKVGDFDKTEVLKAIKGEIEEYYKHNLNYVEEEGRRDVEKLDDLGNTYIKPERVLKIKEDKKEVLDAIIQTIKYSETFALRKMQMLLGKKQEEFAKAIKGKVPGYVRETLLKLKDLKEDKKRRIPDGNQLVYSIYEEAFSDAYKAQTGQGQGEEE